MMQKISFTVLGGVGGSSKQHGTVVDLLSAVPYLLTARLILPLHVVNDVLIKGIYDAGMSGGCKWEPFQIDASEWNELRRAFEASQSGEAHEFVEPPEWVKTIDDWHAWVMIFRYGYHEEFRHLDRECRELERARDQAANEGNEALAEELDERVMEAEAKIAQLAMNARKRDQ